MATFELIDENTYRIDGAITEEDIDRINAFSMKTTLVMQNTRGQKSDIISQITSENVVFSVLTGVDYTKKEKYNTQKYKERTYSTPQGLSMVLQYFESIEAEVNPEWTDMQRSMYKYNALTTDINYVSELPNEYMKDGVMERSSNGLLMGQLTCAGFAKAFQELMERDGQNCHYQNEQHLHAFNVLELEGAYRGIDVTWDCTKREDDKCTFYNFGRDPEFYQQKGHHIDKDPEETVFELKPFTNEEIIANYQVIREAIEKRKRYHFPFADFSTDKKKRVLSFDGYAEKIQEEKMALDKLQLLAKLGFLPEESFATSNPRRGFIMDYLGSKYQYADMEAIEALGKKCHFEGVLRWRYDPKTGERNFALSNVENETKLSEEQLETVGGVLKEEVREYFAGYFERESASIEETIQQYSMLQASSPELLAKQNFMRANLYSKLNLLSSGAEFLAANRIIK